LEGNNQVQQFVWLSHPNEAAETAGSSDDIHHDDVTLRSLYPNWPVMATMKIKGAATSIYKQRLTGKLEKNNGNPEILTAVDHGLLNRS